MGDLLPPRFRRRDLFRRPDIEKLALDEVYSGYVLPGYQAAVARADREAQRADTEAAERDIIACENRYPSGGKPK